MYEFRETDCPAFLAFLNSLRHASYRLSITVCNLDAYLIFTVLQLIKYSIDMSHCG